MTVEAEVSHAAEAQEVLHDVHEAGHLAEHQHAVAASHELGEHAVQQLDLARGTPQVVVDGELVILLEQIRVVANLTELVTNRFTHPHKRTHTAR